MGTRSIITLENVNSLYPTDSEGNKFSLIKKRLVRGNNTRPKYQLLEDLHIRLSNGFEITIPKGFIWDLSSTPRMIWWLLPPDGDFDLAYLIHDYLWIEKEKLRVEFQHFILDSRLNRDKEEIKVDKDGWAFTRKFTDDEMFLWANKINGTEKLSLRNIDNKLRYWGVRAFGWLVWNGIIKLK